MMVQPSLLAADVGDLASACREADAAGAAWLHVDICDGSATCGRSLSCLGPASVAAVRKAAPNLKIDVHLYTREPEAHVQAVSTRVYAPAFAVSARPNPLDPTHPHPHPPPPTPTRAHPSPPEPT